MKIAVGLSGGVDSAVAALLLKEQGHSVVGVTMKLWRGGDGKPVKRNSCYGPDEEKDIAAASEICEILKIPFYCIDCSLQYETTVLEYFRREYKAGRTPNPCIKCNQEIKFTVLPQLLRENGVFFDLFATGHYARVTFDSSRNRYLLMKGRDLRKDQSYFLYRLSQEQLSIAVFPLGELDKKSVRAIAREAKIPVHDKKESQDFYDGDYAELLQIPDKPGIITDTKGNKLGLHRGFWHYTVGQRKGLGVSYKEPLYVISVDANTNSVVVGTHSEAFTRGILVNLLNWVDREELKQECSVDVKVRSTAQPAAAFIKLRDKDCVEVRFPESFGSVAPGQSAVFYDEDRVIGGGIIDKIVE